MTERKTRLSAQSIEWAIRHLAKHGDTDIFPRPIELFFFAERKDEIAEALSQVDLNSYEPHSAVEALTPKSRLGFRVAHELFPLDCLLFTATMAEIGEDIEEARASKENKIAFTYRISKTDEGDLFSLDCTYRSWLDNQIEHLKTKKNIQHVITTDIADFYHRIYFHRIENLLHGVVKKRGYANFVLRFVKHIRARQSYGLPIGGSGSRILAELAMIDVDKALLNEGIDFTRYVDDFRLFVSNEEDAYRQLSFLAETLLVNEGLALNSSKTFVSTRMIYRKKLQNESTDVLSDAEQKAVSQLEGFIYQDEEIPEDVLRELSGKTILHRIKVELKNKHWDTNKIRVLFRALRYARPPEAANFIREKLLDLFIFAKNVVLLMEELSLKNNVNFSDMKEEIIAAITGDLCRNVPVMRAWYLELFSRGIVRIESNDLKKLEPLTGVLDCRQLCLIRGRMKDVNYFRRRKTRFDEISVWESPSFIIGARCLPDDEYESWIKSIKSRVKFPLSGIFLDWAKTFNFDRSFSRVSVPDDELGAP